MLRLHLRLLWGTLLAELRRRMRQPLPVHGKARTLSRPEWEQQDVVGQEWRWGGTVSACRGRAGHSTWRTLSFQTSQPLRRPVWRGFTSGKREVPETPAL